jgi:hypothetical protein
MDDLTEASLKQPGVGHHVRDAQAEAVALQRAALELPVMQRVFEQLDARNGKPAGIGVPPAREAYAEPLGGDGVAVLQARVADIVARPAAPARQLPGDPVRVAAGLAQLQEQVLARACQSKAQFLLDDEVLRAGAQPPATGAAAEGGREVVPGIEGRRAQRTASSSATACAARPSPRPM